MFRQVRFTLRDLRRNWATALMFSATLLFCAFYLLSAVSSFADNARQKRLMDRVKTYDATCFQIYYQNDMVISTNSLGRDLDQYLAVLFSSQGKAFSSVDIVLPGHENIPAQIVFGDFAEVFDLPSLPLESNDGLYVAIGSDVQDIRPGDTLRIGDNGGKKVSVDSHLPTDAAYLGYRYESLRNHIIVFANYEKWKSLFSVIAHYDNLIHNTVLLSSDDGTISEFMHAVEGSGSYVVVPTSWNERLADSYRSIAQSSVLLTVLLGSTVLFIALGITANLLMMMERRLREYNIHRLYGAALYGIYVRTILYVTIIVLCPLLGALYYISKSPFFDHRLISAAAVAAVILILCICVEPILKMKRNDLTTFLRRDQ